MELTERINRTTGGVSVYPFTSSVKGSPDPVAYLMVRMHPAFQVIALVSAAGGTAVCLTAESIRYSTSPCGPPESPAAGRNVRQ